MGAYLVIIVISLLLANSDQLPKCLERCERERPSGLTSSFNFTCSTKYSLQVDEIKRCDSDCDPQTCPKTVCNHEIHNGVTNRGKYYCPPPPTTILTTTLPSTTITYPPTTSTTTNVTSSSSTTKAPTTSTTTQKATPRTPSTSSATTTTPPMPSQGCNGTCDAYRGNRGTNRYELQCDLFPTAEEQHSCKEACAQCPRDICDPQGVQIVYHCPATEAKLKNAAIVTVLIALGCAMLAVCLCSTVAFFVIRRRLKKKKQAAEAVTAESNKQLKSILKRKSRKTLEFSSDSFHDPDADTGDVENMVGRPSIKSISLSTRSRSISSRSGSGKSIADSEASMASVLDHFKFDDYHHTSDGAAGSKKKHRHHHHRRRGNEKSRQSEPEEGSEISEIV